MFIVGTDTGSVVDPSVTRALAAAQDASAELAARHARWLVPLIRAGYAARGFVYCLIGAVAVRTALMPTHDVRTDHGGTHAVLRMLWRGPFGGVLLVAVGLGLCAFACWSFIRALVDPEREGTSAKALARRIGYFFTGIAYGALVWWVVQVLATAIGLISAQKHGVSEHGAKHWTATLMSFPLGRFLVAGVGIGFIVYAALQVRRPWTPQFSQIDRLHMKPGARRWVRRVGLVGTVLRAVVFAMIGLFLLIAAVRFDPRQAEGLGGTLLNLRSEPAGPWLLCIVAVGLFLYGMYDLLLAGYRVIAIDAKR